MHLPKLRKKEKLCYYTLAMLGMICIWNLHYIAEKFLGIDRVLSPVILLLCLFGVFNTPKISYLKGQGRYSMFFLSALSAWIIIGVFAEFVISGRIIATTAVTLGASIVLVGSVVHMACGLVARGHHVRIIRLVFFLSITASFTVYLSYFFPGVLTRFMNVKAAGRLAGIYKNPNMLALQSIFTIVFAFTLSSYTLKPFYMMVGYAASVPTILLTNSRTSILSMLLVSISLSFFVFPPKYVVRALFAFGLLFGILAGGFTYLNSVRTDNSSNWVQQKLADRTDQLFELFTGKVTVENTGGRLGLAKEAIGLWKKNPLLGNGYGSLSKMPVHGLGPHNSYLKILGEAGIFGLLMFVFAWAMLGNRGLSMAPRWSQVLVLGIAIVGSFACLTSHIVLVQRHVDFCLALGFAYANPFVQRTILSDAQGKRFVFFMNPNQRQRGHYPPPGPPMPPGAGPPPPMPFHPRAR